MSNLYIFFLSDLHLGSKNCNLDFFYEWCRRFEDAPDNKVIYCLGDLLEFPTTHIDAYSSMMSTHEALDRLVELLEPYKEYVRYVCTGNHEARTIKDFNYDITKQIASRLDAKYTRNDFFDKIIEDDRELVIFGKHGTRVSKNPLLSMNNFVNEMNHIQADIYAMGHNHQSAFYSQYERGFDGGKRANYLFSGHFLNYDNSYAHDKGLLMSPPSFSRLKVDSKFHVTCETFFEEEMK